MNTSITAVYENQPYPPIDRIPNDVMKKMVAAVWDILTISSESSNGA